MRGAPPVRVLLAADIASIGDGDVVRDQVRGRAKNGTDIEVRRTVELAGAIAREG